MPALPWVKDVLAAEVIAAGASTVRVKDWVAGLPTPLVAVMVIGNEPVVEVVPARVAVPSPLSTKLTPDGRAPDSVRAGFGLPVVVTVKDPEDPDVNAALLDEEMVGAVPTTRVLTDSAVPRLVPRAVWYESFGPLPGSDVVFDSSM